jgi:hypothetical protein
MISNKFAVERTYEPFDSFRHLEQSGPVTTYIDNFEELMGKLTMKDPAVTELPQKWGVRLSGFRMGDSRRRENATNTHMKHTKPKFHWKLSYYILV